MNEFELLKNEIENLKKDVSHFNIGKTTQNRNIVCFVVGSGSRSIFLQGGIHAREYITSFLLIEMIKVLKNFKLNCKVFVVPAVNLDGISLCINGTKNLDFWTKNKVKSFLDGQDCGMYKANFFGVDLNTNFDACWGKGKQNISKPYYQNFVGYLPNSEIEVKALKNFVDTFDFDLTLSYHSKGEVVYWGFDKKSVNEKNVLKKQNFKNIKVDYIQKKYFDRKKYVEIEKNIKKIVKKDLGYKLIFTKNSCGGFKDYCILKREIPSFTIEVGSDDLSHPIKRKFLPIIFDKNINFLLEVINYFE